MSLCLHEITYCTFVVGSLLYQYVVKSSMIGGYSYATFVFACKVYDALTHPVCAFQDARDVPCRSMSDAMKRSPQKVGES